MQIANMISLATGIFTAIGVFIAAYSVLLNTQRAKKELAVTLISDWSRDYNLTMKHAFDLAKIIDDATVERITRYENDVVIEGSSAITALSYILSKSNQLPSEEKKQNEVPKITLTSGQCRILDFQWMQTLHRIEAMLIAWKSNAADPEIMEKQFEPLIKAHSDLLKKLTSGDEYPVIKHHLDKP